MILPHTRRTDYASGMSNKAQAILEEIRGLPPQDFRAVCEELRRWWKPSSPTSETEDPMRSARGMFLGGNLAETLLASRAEERCLG